MSLRFAKIGPDGVDPLHAIVAECGTDMFQRFGLAHWHPPFPIETMRTHAAERDVVAVYDDAVLVGTFTTGNRGADYDDSLWNDLDHKALYLGKLAIRPRYQSCGYGRLCLKEVEKIAQTNAYQTIRFDTITAHPLLVSFYLAQGYLRRGEMTLVDTFRRTWGITLFEKLMPV